VTAARLAIALAVVAALAGCGASAGTPEPASSRSAPSVSTPAAAVSPEVVPETASTAKSAAEAYFDLYGAGQYAAVYPMIAPADRQYIREKVWTGVHQECKSPSAGLTYSVKHPVLAGSVAVVSVSLSGAAAALGSEQVSFTYADGKWYYLPSDLSIYRHHDVAQALKAARAAGLC
jgi:hypothetical protein